MFVKNIKIDNINDLIDFYLSNSKIRHERLFKEFLPSGYKMTTISCVSKDYFKTVMLAKMYLGMIITLYDDLADNPKYKNSSLLKAMYSLLDNLEDKNLSRGIDPRLSLANNLIHGLFETTKILPNGSYLKNLLEFDLRQVFLANRYCELLNEIPGVANIHEARHHGPYNMGMVAAGTIDLMGSKEIPKDKIGKSRDVFLKAQRYGRICNVLTTFKREQNEGDLTNEILIYLKNSKTQDSTIESYRDHLENEMNHTIQKIISSFNEVGFNVSKYARGLEDFFLLHKSLVGII